MLDLDYAGGSVLSLVVCIIQQRAVPVN